MSENERQNYSKVPVILFYPKDDDHLGHTFIPILEAKGSRFEFLKTQLSLKSKAYQNAVANFNLVDIAKIVDYIPKEEANESFTSEDL